jgi:hypothetical protein
MDPDLNELVQEQLRAQASERAIRASTDAVYEEKLAAWWRPYATPRGLPGDLGAEGAHSLSPGQLMALIGAAHTGELRRLTRDGARDRAQVPLSPPSLDGLLAALSHTHLSNGLAWHGDAREVLDARAGYRRVHSEAQRQAAAMAAEHAVALFARPSRDSLDPMESAARARSIALALGVRLRDLPDLTPEVVTAHDADEGAVTLSKGRTVVVPCLRSFVDDVVAESACAHCGLRDWTVHYEHLGPLVADYDLRNFRLRLRRWIRHVPNARVDGDVLTSVADDPWTAVAVGLPSSSQSWLRARAVLLPMRVVGMRLDDLDGLSTAEVRIKDDGATFSLTGKGEQAGHPHAVTLEATGDAMCPVNAVRTYEHWVRAHGCSPTRPRWVVPLRGKAPYRYPTQVEVPTGSRALYQSIRLWMVDHTSSLFADTDTDATHLTPHSARRGFVTQAQAEKHDVKEIQDAMRHRKISTTIDYFEEAAKGSAARRLLDHIAEERNGAAG